MPFQFSSFIGRIQEIAAVRRELARSRLVILTGPGGMRNTRLALRPAENGKSDRSADGDGSNAIGERRLLLILDNCDRLIDHAPGKSVVYLATLTVAVSSLASGTMGDC